MSQKHSWWHLERGQQRFAQCGLSHKPVHPWPPHCPYRGAVPVEPAVLVDEVFELELDALVEEVDVGVALVLPAQLMTAGPGGVYALPPLSAAPLAP